MSSEQQRSGIRYQAPGTRYQVPVSSRRVSSRFDLDSPKSTTGDIVVTVSHGTLGAPAGIEDQVRAAVASEGHTVADLSIVLTDHATVTRLNELHLNRTYPTDVLAFDLSDDDGDGETSVSRRVQGEIYVDLDTALDRAPEFGTSYESEVMRYVFHGLLHLMGYRDDEPDARQEMRRLENLYLGKTGIR